MFFYVDLEDDILFTLDFLCLVTGQQLHTTVCTDRYHVSTRCSAVHLSSDLVTSSVTAA